MIHKLYDVIVIGAGAAGLACADLLTQKSKLNILVLEGQNRIGGRAHTVYDGVGATPVELGPEFIHGAPASTLQFMQRFQESFYDVTDNHHVFEKSKLKKSENFMDQMKDVMSELSIRGKKDRSVADFLKAHKKHSPKIRDLFRAYVEGFHAADMNLLGEHGLAATEEASDDELNGSSAFRLTKGYSNLLKKISENLRQKNCLRLETTVKEVHWKSGHVQLKCRSLQHTELQTYQARRIVMTIPLGVIQSMPSSKASIQWFPVPPQLKSACNHLRMGHVQKMTFQFNSRFWEELDKKEPVTYVHLGPENYFPTWWTLMPMRTNHLVAWQGGPFAQEMAHWTQDKLLTTALNSLSRWSRLPASTLPEQLLSYHTHNWSQDPYALGAYSYVQVHGLYPAMNFAKPIAKTIYFAGEATCAGPSRGTMHGAFNSGIKAARKILNL